MPHLTLIAALDRARGIGRDNELLVRLPEDMARFKALTIGHTVLMGRKTWDSIPAKFRPLVQRRNLVLSRQPGLALDGAEVFATLDQALAAIALLTKRRWMEYATFGAGAIGVGLGIAAWLHV